MPVSFRVNGLSCLFCLSVLIFDVIFRFYFVHYYSNMHACRFFFRLAIYPSIHSSSIHFATYLPFFVIYLRDIQKKEAVARFAEDRFTDRVIFSSKITFLYHQCFSIFRIFNKLNNTSWKSVLSPTSSPFSCQRS